VGGAICELIVLDNVVSTTSDSPRQRYVPEDTCGYWFLKRRQIC
jgi:hypothetical protein